MFSTTEKASKMASTLAMILGFGLLGSSAYAQGGPGIELTNGTQQISQLPVGDDLFVGLRGASPSTNYDFRLSSADGLLITGAYATADAAGNVAPKRVWSRTGVVGCDCAAGADPLSFRFADYSQAEHFLAGQELTLQILTLDGVEVARQEIPVLALMREITYFSNAAGCPRKVFRVGESVHVSFLHPDLSKTNRRIFLAEPRSWPIGQTIDDVRGASQSAALGSSGELLTLPLAGSQQLAKGSYDGIVRAGGTISTWVLPGDGVMANPLPGGTCPLTEGGGIIITVDGCPNCGGTGYP